MREQLRPESMVLAVGDPLGELFGEEQKYAALFAPPELCNFTAGRDAARAALIQLGCEAVAIRSDRRGVPLFPKGVLGSISHKEGRGVAIATVDKNLRGVGIDLEFDEAHDEKDHLKTIIAPGERSQLRALVSAHEALRSPATLVHSAKEALYKAVFPIWGKRFDFDDVMLRFDPTRKRFIGASFPGRKRLEVGGGYAFVSRWIIAVAVVRPRPRV